jgi:hypothetical protein
MIKNWSFVKVTWVYFFNYYFLQVFGIRLARILDNNTGKQTGWKFIKRPFGSGWIK